MRILVTGATGMAGSHLADLLLVQGHDVHIMVRPRSRMANVEHLLGRVTVHTADVRSASAIEALISDFQFDAISHCAADTSVPNSWRMPDETLHTNVAGTLHILEAVRHWSAHTVVHIAGSSEQYGRVTGSEVPIRETQPFRPLSPYGVSKVTQELLALQYRESHGLKVCITRAFNHESPRRWETSAPAGFAQQIAEAEVGLAPRTIRVGNLDAVRDYLDARDVVRAYLLVMQRRIYGEPLNIASGRGWVISDVLSALLARAEVPLAVESDPTRQRPSDVPLLVGDASALRQRTGWAPEIPFETTLDELLAERRRLVGLSTRSPDLAPKGGR